MSLNHGIPTDDVTCGRLVKHSPCITYVPTFDVHVYKATTHKDIRLIGEWSFHGLACLLPLQLHSHMQSALPDWVNLWNTLQASSILPHLAYLSTRLLPTWTFDSQPLWVTCVCMPLPSSCALKFAHTMSTQTEIRLSGSVIFCRQILLLFQPKNWENLGNFWFCSVNLTNLAIFWKILPNVLYYKKNNPGLEVGPIVAFVGKVISPLQRIWEKLMPNFFHHPSLTCHELMKCHTTSWALQSDCQVRSHLQCTSSYLLPSEQSNHIWTLKKLHTMDPH